MCNVDTSIAYLNGNECIKKTYFFKKENNVGSDAKKAAEEAEEIALRCANELIARKYLEEKGITCVTKLLKIEPETVATLVNSFQAHEILNNFNNIKDIIQKFFEDNSITEISIYIEKGIDNVENKFFIKSNVNITDAEKTINDIFDILHIIHYNSIVHGDIKPDNFVFCIRDGIENLVLNDFDTTFVLRNGYISHQVDNPRLSYFYAAPEQFRAFKNNNNKSNNNIGYATDVFSAGLISYRLLNQGVHPDIYRIDENDNRTNDDIYNDIRDMFKYFIAAEKLPWNPPKYGNDKLKQIILKCMSLRKEDRPTAKNVKDMINGITDNKKTENKENNHVENITNNYYNVENKGGNVVIGDDNECSPDSKYKISSLVLVIAAIATVILLIIAVVIREGKLFNDSNKLDDSNNNSSLIVGNISQTSTTLYNTVEAEVTTTEATTTEVTTTFDNIETQITELTTTATNGGGIKQNTIIYGSGNTITNNNNVDNYYNDITINNNSSSSNHLNESNENEKPKNTSKFSYVESPYTENCILLTGFDKSIDFKEKILNIPAEIDGFLVEGIAENAFSNNEYIEEIYIPDNVYTIYNSAFCNLYNLKKVHIGRSVNSIYEKAFLSEPCNNMRTYYFPREDYISLLRGDYCLGASESEYKIEFYDLQ